MSSATLSAVWNALRNRSKHVNRASDAMGQLATTANATKVRHPTKKTAVRSRPNRKASLAMVAVDDAVVDVGVAVAAAVAVSSIRTIQMRSTVAPLTQAASMDRLSLAKLTTRTEAISTAKTAISATTRTPATAAARRSIARVMDSRAINKASNTASNGDTMLIIDTVIAMANDTATVTTTVMGIVTTTDTEIATTTDTAIATLSSKVGSKVGNKVGSRTGSRTGNSKGRSRMLPRSPRRLSAQASWKSCRTPMVACANLRMA